MTAARNQTNAFFFDQPELLARKSSKNSRLNARLLKIERNRSRKKSALRGTVKHKKANTKRGRIAAAKTISKTSLEVGPTAALCLLLLDELGL